MGNVSPLDSGHEKSTIHSFVVRALRVGRFGLGTPFSRGETRAREGRYAEAASQFEAALREAERDDPEDVRVPVTWNNLGVVCRVLGRTRQAERYYRLSIAYYEKHPGLETSLATTLENLAALDVTMGQTSRAESLYRRSLEIRRGLARPGDSGVSEVLHGLAQLEHSRHRYQQAEAYYREALTIQKKAFGETSAREDRPAA
jgi:Tfp pilus assembly protein PilF